MKALRPALTNAGIFLFSISTIIAAADRANAESPPGQPKLCTGYDAARGRWGPIQINGAVSEDLCPSGSAVFAYGFSGGKSWYTSSDFSIEAYCCPLPDGALTDEHRFVEEECPEGFVVTGGRAEVKDSTRPQDRKYLLRCTSVDKAHYQLGPQLSGWTVGWEQGLTTDTIGDTIGDIIGTTFGGVPRQTTWNQIPAGLRYGLLRRNRGTWEDGCVAYPWGGIMTGRTGDRCPQVLFRELQLRSVSSSTRIAAASEQVVAVYPSCRAVDDPFSPEAKCAGDSFASTSRTGGMAE